MTEAGEGIGKRVWVIAEGWIPSGGLADHTLMPHETACILNAGPTEATIELTVFFSDRDPVHYALTVPPRRTRHLRFDGLLEPSIPRDTDYSSLFVSDVPVVVQHTRLDSRRAEIALMTTMAYCE